MSHSLHIPLRPGIDIVPPGPLAVHAETVQPAWIDYNGHMNVAYYVLAFDHATDRLFDLIDLGADYMKRTNHSSFVLETHVTYAREVRLGDPLAFTARLLDCDDKRLHYFLEMHHATEGFLSATSEQICLHVDMSARRSAPFPDGILARVAAIREAQAGLPVPPQVGSVIGIRRRS